MYARKVESGIQCQVILFGAGRNPERCMVVMCN